MTPADLVGPQRGPVPRQPVQPARMEHQRQLGRRCRRHQLRASAVRRAAWPSSARSSGTSRTTPTVRPSPTTLPSSTVLIRRDLMSKYGIKISIFNSLWFSLGAFMQQGCDIEPRYATASSGHSNGEEYPHRRRTRIVQSYSPGGADMHVHLIQCPWVHARAPVQTASRSVHPFLHILSFYPDPLLLGLQCSSVDSGQSAKCPFPCWICTGFQLGGGG